MLDAAKSVKKKPGLDIPGTRAAAVVGTFESQRVDLQKMSSSGHQSRPPWNAAVAEFAVLDASSVGTYKCLKLVER